MFWSKTIQSGERLLHTPLVAIPQSILCPVLAFKRMCSFIKASAEDPLFLLPSKRPVTYQMFQNKLKSCISKIGLDPADFSSHSFRRGGASLALRADIEADKIQLMGDWRSEAYKKYLTFSFEDKIQVSEDMKFHLLSELSASN